jgi:hypothetical protein
MRQWLVLAARWWNNMAEKEHTSFAYKAFKDDMILMGQGCSACWAWQFLDAMTTIKVVTAKDWKPRHCKNVENLLNLRFDESMVKASAEEWFDRAWDRCSREPESAGEDEVFRSTY